MLSEWHWKNIRTKPICLSLWLKSKSFFRKSFVEKFLENFPTNLMYYHIFSRKCHSTHSNLLTLLSFVCFFFILAENSTSARFCGWVFNKTFMLNENKGNFDQLFPSFCQTMKQKRHNVVFLVKCPEWSQIHLNNLEKCSHLSRGFEKLLWQFNNDEVSANNIF